MKNKQKQINTQIAFKIKSARIESELTQESLGNIIGLSRASIANIEKNRQIVSIHKLIEISKATNKNIEYFIGTNGEDKNIMKVSYSLGFDLHKKLDKLPRPFVLKMLSINKIFSVK